MWHDSFSKTWLLIPLVTVMMSSDVIAFPLFSSQTEPTNQTQVLNKDAVNDLVQRAAELNELKTVLTTGQKLPLAKKPITLQASHELPVNKSTSVIPIAMAHQEVSPMLARCSYQGQSYVPGDTVKTGQGWLRCNPTIIFVSNDKNSIGQAGSPAWVVVQ